MQVTDRRHSRADDTLISEVTKIREDVDKATQELRTQRRVQAVVWSVVITAITIFTSVAWDDRRQVLIRMDHTLISLAAATAELQRLRVDHSYLQEQVDKIRDRK